MNENGRLVISLDFELLWGLFDVIEYEKKQDYFITTRWIIPELLRLFEENKINCTWAVVGMLFNRNWDEWKLNIPKEVPEYKNKELSAYHFGKTAVSSKTEKLCFAPELIKLISTFPGQEIATHTYSHYYCDEPGQDKFHFKLDLEKAIEMAKKINVDIESLVFPRNQLNEEYLNICHSAGIKNVRSNPSSWYWQKVSRETLLTRISRTGDAYLPVSRKSYPQKDLLKSEGNPQKQKASRFLRPPESVLLRKLKVKRITTEMTSAANRNEIYHLWWHPHNFGDKPIDGLNDLVLILDHYQKLNNKYNFTSANMAELNTAQFKKDKADKIVK